MAEITISKTGSVCPKCLEVIPAEIFARDGKVFIRKECPKHGKVEDVYWASTELYRKAMKFAKDGRPVSNPNVTKSKIVCPRDCGLCEMHRSHTALGNIAVTNRCDLSCWYCFFFAQKAGYVYEPSLGSIREMASKLASEKPIPCNAIQLTGGEPTLREDLLDIVRICKEEGIDHVQLNTNGIRLSKDVRLVRRLREEGVNTIYLSFDGVRKKTNPKNHWEVPGVLRNCRRVGMGIVLVPTVIRGVNDQEIGDILRFGFENMDIVRAVNYQPVSLVGRMPKKERDKFRITIPDTIRCIEEQTGGQITKDDFYPVPTVTPVTRFVEALTRKPEYHLSSHFACGMATYVFEKDGKIVPITRFVDVEGLLNYLDSMSEKAREGNRYLTGIKVLWKIRSFIDKNKAPKGLSLAKILYNALIKHDYNALGEFHKKSLFIGMMHFMDLYNYDIERVKRCCIHYALPDGRIIPFCTFNVMPELYRDKAQEELGINISKWEKRTGRKLTDDLYKRDLDTLERLPEYKKTYSSFR